MECRRHKVWPARVPETFVVEKPTCEYIRERAALTPEKIALGFYGRDASYAKLNRMIDAMAWGPVEPGVKKGDSVAIHMENCPQFVIAYFGSHSAGAVVATVNPMSKHAEPEYEIGDAGAETLIGLDRLYPDVEKVESKTPLRKVILTSLRGYLTGNPVLPLPPEAQEPRRSFPGTLDSVYLTEKARDRPMCNVIDLQTDLALLQPTDGTTGILKGAMISHYANTIVASVRSC